MYFALFHLRILSIRYAHGQGQGQGQLVSVPVRLVVKWRRVVWVPLFLATVVVVIASLGIVHSLSLGLVSVQVIQALRLKQLVHLGTGNSSKSFFGKSMAHWLSLSSLSVFKHFGSGKGGSAGKQFVGEVALVLFAVNGIVGLLVVFVVAESKHGEKSWLELGGELGGRAVFIPNPSLVVTA